MSDHHMTLSWKTFTPMYINEWRTGSVPGLVAAVLVSFVIAIVYEIFTAGLLFEDKSWKTDHKNTRSHRSLTWRLGRTLQQMLYVFTSYLLMLSAMSMNLWVLSGVILGTGIGFFIARFFSNWLVARERVKRTNRKFEVERRLMQASVLSSPELMTSRKDFPPSQPSPIIETKQHNDSVNSSAAITLQESLESVALLDKETNV